MFHARLLFLDDVYSDLIVQGGLATTLMKLLKWKWFDDADGGFLKEFAHSSLLIELRCPVSLPGAAIAMAKLLLSKLSAYLAEEGVILINELCCTFLLCLSDTY